MRHFRHVAAALATAAILLSGCAAGPTVAGLLAEYGISAKDTEGLRLELRFLKESRGSNYKFDAIQGDSDLFGEIVKALNASRYAEKPKEERFSPELRSDCELVFKGNSGTVSFLYIIQSNTLIYPERKRSEQGEALEYRYYTAGDKLAGLIEGRRQHAVMMKDTTVKPFRNMEELKASIDPEELAEEGEELDFEFFTESTPANAGTACRIYTSAECPALPQDSYLITAYGKNDAGEQIQLWILGMEANSCYTKIIVTEPDEALLSVEAGDAPDSHAIAVKKEIIDPSKWIVFVDSENNVLDIILPEDIKE